MQDLKSNDITPGSSVIVTVEVVKPLLSTLSEKEFAAVQNITNNASKLLWVTGANLVRSQKPEASIILGLSRTLMAEQPSLEFFVVDIDDLWENIDLTVSNLLAVLKGGPETFKDYEYLQKNGVLHVSRFVADSKANQNFQKRKTAESSAKSLQEVGLSRLSIKEPGQMDTLQFIQGSRLELIPENYLEIYVKAVGINAKVLLCYLRLRT